MTLRERVLCALVAALTLCAATAEPKDREDPRESGIVESSATRLIQLDVTVSGPKEAIAALVKDDFVVKINHQRVTSFLVDRLCGDAPEQELLSPSSHPAPPGASPRPVSYLFYFDHPHLTMPGRKRAITLARELLPKLLAEGGRAMIVSNARGLRTIAPFNSDAQELLRALADLEGDNLEWDYYPQQEPARIADVVQSLNRDGVERALSKARIYAKDDRWRGERNARRLAMTLGLLTQVDQPKAVLYFADTMRGNPGELYLSLFPESQLRGRVPAPVNLLDHVIQEASAHGIRFYPVEARGLAALETTGLSLGGSYRAVLSRSPSAAGIQTAQDSLVSLALETGGAAFLNGLSAEKIAQRVIADLSCLFLISFDPEGFPEDGPLAVTVKTRREDVKLQTRGELVIQSESARRTSRLLAAFLAPEATKSDVPLTMHLIPTGYLDGAFSALVQVAVAGMDTPSSIWDLGASLVSRERVQEEGSGRISVGVSGVAAVFEREMRFSPGPYELVSAAHEVRLGQIASRRDEGTWPDPESADAVVGPIAVVQPASAAFLRNGKATTSGALAHDDRDPARTDRPTVLVAIVCRGKGARRTFRIERSLEGDGRAEFPPLDVDLREDRCALFRDLVQAGTMRPGFFRYEIRVLEDGAEIARAERKFPAVGPPADSRPG